MSFLIIDGERYALSLGETTLGGAEDEVLRASALAALPPFAVLRVDGVSASIRALPSSVAVLVRGEAVGPAPRPLRHGDDVSVAGLTMRVGDLANAGRTTRAGGVTDADLAEHARLGAADPTAATGGRLTAANGRAYDIPSGGLSIGRDPDCDVVLTSSSVSRRHARVVPGLLGYSLVDDSTNGLTVNGARADRSSLLNQGDVIQIGGESLRFSADVASYEPDAALFDLPRVPPVSRSPAASPETPTLEVRTMPPAAPPPAPLATLEIVAGSLPPALFELTRPVIQIGRSPDGDVCLRDESVSSAHATLIQRDGTWQLSDLGSRNGTYVEGRRVTHCVLDGVCEVAIGSVTLRFRPVRSGTATSASNVGTLAVFGVTGGQVRAR